MRPSEARDVFNAVRLHFGKNSSYNYFKYDGRLRRKKGDEDPAWKFTLLSRQFDDTELPQYLGFIIYRKPKIWVNQLLHKDHLESWRKWKERQKNRVQYLNEELKLFTKMDIDHAEHEYPVLFNKIDYGVSLDTFIIVDSVLQITKKWDQSLQDDFAYVEWVARYRKWRPFFYAYMPYDRDTFQQIVSKELI